MKSTQSNIENETKQRIMFCIGGTINVEYFGEEHPGTVRKIRVVKRRCYDILVVPADVHLRLCVMAGMSQLLGDVCIFVLFTYRCIFK